MTVANDQVCASQRPLRVAMIHYRDEAAVGGSLRVGQTLTDHLDPKRIEAQLVFAYGQAGPVANAARVPCHFIKAKGPRDLPAWYRARRLFRDLNPDLIHFQEGVVWLRTALSYTSSRKIFHVHGRYEKPSAKSNRANPFRATPLLHAYLRSTDAHVCISDGARQALLDIGWTSPAKSHVVFNAIDLARFTPVTDSGTARNLLQLPRDVKLLGMVCRLVKEKGCSELLSLIARLPGNWHGVICGDGPQRTELEMRAAQLGISDRIHFLGSLDDVRPVYAALDAYVFLSSYEPFGLVLAEAMACQVPVFGVMGAGEYCEPRYPLIRADNAVMISGQRDAHGFLLDGVISTLATRIDHFSSHKDEYLPMIVRARTWVEKCFAGNVQAEAMTRVYEVVSGRSQNTGSLTQWYRTNAETAELWLRGTATAAVA